MSRGRSHRRRATELKLVRAPVALMVSILLVGAVAGQTGAQAQAVPSANGPRPKATRAPKASGGAKAPGGAKTRPPAKAARPSR